MAAIKQGKVKRTTYRKETNHSTLKGLITAYLAAGKGALLFKDPHILAAFYLLGDAALSALSLAITDYENKTNGGSILTIEDKMALVVIWIDSYADQAEVIANDPANRSTQAEAITNLNNAGLPTQKAASATKGKPAISEVTAKKADGGIKAKITNAHSNVYTQLTIIAVSVPPAAEPAVAPAVVTITGDQFSVTCAAPVHVISKTIKGHPTEASLAAANPLLSYDIYVITQNGKKLVSDISLVVTVHPV
jgi:hypothetical protein